MPEESDLQKEVSKMFGKTGDGTPSVKPTADERGPLKSLRTFQGDMADTLLRTRGSVASVAIAEHAKQENLKEKVRTEETVTTKAEHTLFIYFGLIFIVLGSITISTIYFLRILESPVEVRNQSTLLAYTDHHNVPFSDNKTTLESGIISAMSSFNRPPNSVLYISIGSASGTPEKIEKVLGVLTTRMPASLLRSFSGPYMIGVYSFDMNAPFIVLSTADFGQSYPGMLKWENGMIDDIGTIFGIPPKTAGDPYVFEDQSIRNKDLRVVKNAERKTILLYSFLDKNTILITANENVFNAILGKFITTQMAR